MAITVEPIKPLLGGVVHCTKEDLFAPGAAATILAALADRGALVFPRLGFTDEEQLRFTDSLGDRLNFTNTVPGADNSAQDVYTITLDKSVNSEPEYVLGSMYWHQDGVITPNSLSPITLLSCKARAEQGGQTEFAHTAAAFEALAPEEQKKLEGLRVMHTTVAAVREIKSKDQLDPHRGSYAHEHPLVWTRPDGRKALIIGCHADYIVGMDKAVGRIIINRLLEWCSRPEFTIRHHWSVGDFAMWDNTTMLHRALPYAEDSGRRMHRTSVGGSVALA